MLVGDGVASRHSIGPSAFGRFPQVSDIASDWMSSTFPMLPKPAEIDQAWPILWPASRRRTPAVTCNRQQGTHVPLTSRLRQNAETCGRTSQLFACRRKSGDHVRFVDGCRYGKSAPADGWNGKRPYFCGLRRFAKDFRFNQRLLSVPDAKRRKPQKRRKAEVCGRRSSDQHCWTVSSSIETGMKRAEESQSKPPSILPAPAAGGSVFQTNGGDD